MATLPDWPATPREAVAVQRRLAARVERADRHGPIATVAGVDVGYDKRRGVARAAAVVLSFPDLEERARAVVERPVDFPYVPGLLSFREVPAALDVLAALPLRPDLVLCDGQGIAHPRRFGLACHLGLVADLPTVGVAKSRLVGTFDAPGPGRGDRAPLMDRGEVIGAVLRTRAGVSPLFVSIGHRVSLDRAVDFVLACAPRYRLPETTRLADRLSKTPRSPKI
ncbi:MAG: deoxyribonuclease V [Hyphomicrobiales bacterium]|nr:deoxyribonuclease V [Hyphomicrobiales bacterium]MCP5373120.1 deoxyribonuclease V [Hyphomicrobiales bacterium]